MKVIDNNVYTFSAENAPAETACPGEVLLFRTLDCFGGQIKAECQTVQGLDMDHTNPAAGPVRIEGAAVGDVLMVDILDVAVEEAGIVCSMDGDGPLSHIAQVRTRKIPIQEGYAQFNGIQWPVRPMIGVIGTAPEEGTIGCGFTGNHGGNMDSRHIRKGTRVYLPVRVPGAMLQMGDVHATMGDGELCGTGIEIGSEILIKTRLIKDFQLNWPVTETEDWWYVNTTGTSYDEALKLGCEELCRLMQPVYGWDATDIFLYLSMQGTVEINQGMRPAPCDMLNLRVGVPKLEGRTLIH